MATTGVNIKAALQQANKILNFWIAQKGPLYIQAALRAQMQVQYAEELKAAKLARNQASKNQEQSEESEPPADLANFIDKLRMEAKVYPTPGLNYCIFADEQFHSSIAWIDDLNGAAYQALKETKDLLKSGSMTDEELLGFKNFLTKFVVILYDSLDPLTSLYPLIEKWAHLGSTIIAPYSSQKPPASILSLTHELSLLYSSLAQRLACDGHDLSNENAERLLYEAERLLANYNLDKECMRLNLASVFCTKIRIALHRYQDKQAIEYLQKLMDYKLTVVDTFEPQITRVFQMAGYYFQQSKPALALKYFQFSLMAYLPDHHFEEVTLMRSAVVAIMKEFRVQFKQHFLNIKIEALQGVAGLSIYMPFDTLPKDVQLSYQIRCLQGKIKIVGRFDGNMVKEKTYTGIKFETALTDPNEIIPILQDYKKVIDADVAKKNKKARRSSDTTSSASTSQSSVVSARRSSDTSLTSSIASASLPDVSVESLSSHFSILTLASDSSSAAVLPSTSPSTLSADSSHASVSASVSALAQPSASSRQSRHSDVVTHSFSSSTNKEAFESKWPSKDETKRRVSDTTSMGALVLSKPIPKNKAWPRTVEYGFDSCDLPITAIYPTSEAKRLGKTRMFAVWEDVAGLSQEAIAHFRSMLTPHEGMLAVRERGEAGLKLETVPNDRDMDWGNCAVRLKSKGIFGSYRIFANHKEKITVRNDEGNQETRYLFSFGKLFRK